MLKLATARDARFDIYDRELRRAGPPCSYDTPVDIRMDRGPEPPTGLVTRTLGSASLRERQAQPRTSYASWAMTMTYSRWSCRR